jgi:hypothetical protein
VLATFVAINCLFVRPFRKFPAVLTTLMLVMAAYSALAYVVPTLAGWNRTLCSGQFTPATQAHAPCGAQAWFIMTGTLGLAFYWMFVACFMFIALRFGKIYTGLPVQIAVHAVALGIPLVNAIVLFSLKTYARCWYGHAC